MKTGADLVAHAVRAYRDLTNDLPDGQATRARVLALMEQRRRWGQRARRLSVGAILAALIAGSGALAAARVARWAQPPGLVLLDGATPLHAPEPAGLLRPRRTIPAAQPPGAQAPDADEESVLYGAAHAAHFAGGDPQTALAAWNAYLRRYPHGAFAPEARFNRAICLIRTGQPEAASAALAPFAASTFGGYRRAEAQRLLDWLRQPALSAAPGR